MLMNSELVFNNEEKQDTGLLGGLFFNYFIVVQLQLSAFSPHSSPPPQPNPPKTQVLYHFEQLYCNPELDAVTYI